MKRFQRATIAMSVLLLLLGITVSRASGAITTMPSTGNMIYFVMLDRFANGNTSNDKGDPSGFSSGGYDPSNSGYYHGGDIKGLTDKIPYIKGLGFNTIWVTPVMKQVTFSGGDKGSTSYHGYWISGFDQIDPHVGTMDQFKNFVTTAHNSGLRVILDIVTNHTTNAIRYREGDGYVYSNNVPWKTSDGKSFNAAAVADSAQFPALSSLTGTNTSFPKSPYIQQGYENVKSPAWLNDVRNYHNRGSVQNYTDESSQYGDFFGLDDLFTESPVVLNGMVTIFSDWIKNTGVDGFRIDTVRHVNKEFWQGFLPAMRAAAASVGKTNFPMYGEVFDADPKNTSYWVKNAGFNEMLDFPFQSAAMNYVQTGVPDSLVDVFNNDNAYLTSRSSADHLGTFLDNHDMGRIGGFLAGSISSTSTQLSLDQMAHALLFTVRGNPIVYYGDEFGLQGGGDKEARQDLFPTGVSNWKTQPRIGGTPIGDKSSFDTTNPLQTTIRTLATLRATYPAFSNGIQQIRYASNGMFITTRFDMTEKREYIVAFNMNSKTMTPSLTLPTVGASWLKLAGTGTASSSAGKVVLTVPALSWAVFRASTQVPNAASMTATITKPVINSADSSSLYLEARVTGSSYSSVQLQASSDGKTWMNLGANRNPIFSISTDPTKSGFYIFKPARSQFTKGLPYQFRVQVTGIGGIIAGSPSQTFTP